VKSVEELIALTHDLTEGKTAPVPAVVLIDRKTDRLLTVIKVGIKEFDDPGLEARKAWLPAALQVITREMAEQLGTNGLTGVRVTQVYHNSTAEQAGLKVGDLIVSLDGERISASQPGDEEVFTSRIRQYRVDDKPALGVIRDNQPLTLAVELQRTPRLEREMKKFQEVNYEFTVRDLSFFDRVRQELPEDLPGALVMEVKEGGWAALGGLVPDDVIQAVNGEPIADILAVEKKMKAVAQQKPKFVVVRVQRGIHTRYLELAANWNSNP
jgi:S1-C subfamily serine protease